MRRNWRAISMAACLLAMALVVMVLATRDGGSATSGASLPSACENFARASELFARGGSAQSMQMTGGQVLTRDADADSKQILMDLIQSCDAERSGR
jgi:hypothetical protein